ADEDDRTPPACGRPGAGGPGRFTSTTGILGHTRGNFTTNIIKHGQSPNKKAGPLTPACPRCKACESAAEVRQNYLGQQRFELTPLSPAFGLNAATAGREDLPVEAVGLGDVASPQPDRSPTCAAPPAQQHHGYHLLMLRQARG